MALGKHKLMLREHAKLHTESPDDKPLSKTINFRFTIPSLRSKRETITVHSHSSAPHLDIFPELGNGSGLTTDCHLSNECLEYQTNETE